MDYVGLSSIVRHNDFKAFRKKYKKSRIVLMTTKAKKLYHKFKFKKDDMLLFGRESAGVPEDIHKMLKNKIKIPMNKKTRSLNVAISVAIVATIATLIATFRDLVFLFIGIFILFLSILCISSGTPALSLPNKSISSFLNLNL